MRPLSRYSRISNQLFFLVHMVKYIKILAKKRAVFETCSGLLDSSLDEIALGVDMELGESFLNQRDLVLDRFLVGCELAGANIVQQVFIATLHEGESTLHGVPIESAGWHKEPPFYCLGSVIILSRFVN